MNKIMRLSQLIKLPEKVYGSVMVSDTKADLLWLACEVDATPGTGTQVMLTLCDWADKKQMELSVFVAGGGYAAKLPFGAKSKTTTSFQRLVDFYSRFGFQLCLDEFEMIRKPKKPCNEEKKSSSSSTTVSRCRRQKTRRECCDTP